MKKIFFIFIACTAIISCGKEESQLNRTIFIPDENNRNLPAYTEWGYNSFGAKYERSYFLASNKLIPCKILYRNDSLHFSLHGDFGDKPHDKMSLIFSFPFETINNYKDLLKLHKKIIDIKSNCIVKLIVNDHERTLNGASGELSFKRIQLLSVDDIANRAILSGIFEVRFLGSNQFPESFSDGRFDFGITDREFYFFED